MQAMCLLEPLGGEGTYRDLWGMIWADSMGLSDSEFLLDYINFVFRSFDRVFCLLQKREGGRYVYVIDNIIRCAAMTLQIAYLNSQSEEEKP